MDISISGKYDKMSRKEIKYMIDFFAKVLLGNRLSKNCSIDIVFEPMGTKFCGFCTPLEDVKKPRLFELEVNSKMSRKMVMRTLAHEMVHVMQFARNTFRILDEDDKYKWKGKVMKMKRERYFHMPWEKEAHQSEDFLLEFYSQHCKLNKVSFK